MNQRPNQTEYGRTTITVPKPLKRRMRQAGLGVNWSAVACEAFRRKLRQLQSESPSEGPDPLPSKEDAIARLRQMKEAGSPGSAPLMQEGLEKGKRWAMAGAHPDELSRLEQFCEEHHVDKAPESWTVDVSKPPQVKRLFRQLTAELLQLPSSDAARSGPGKRRPGVTFWKEQVGATDFPPEAAWIQGFAKGAVDFWREVKSQV